MLIIGEKHGIGFRFHNVGIKIMEIAQNGQCQNGPQDQPVTGDFEAVTPNHKLRLMDQARIAFQAS
jgi:DNA-directed RNA polymerase alpha subunit